MVCVISATLWIVLFATLLSAGAVIGALVTLLVRGRCTGHSRLTYAQQSFSVVTSGTVLTAEVGSPASPGLATQTCPVTRPRG